MMDIALDNALETVLLNLDKLSTLMLRSMLDEIYDELRRRGEIVE